MLKLLFLDSVIASDMHKPKLIPPSSSHIQISIAVEIVQARIEVHLLSFVKGIFFKVFLIIILKNVSLMRRAFVFVCHQIDITVIVDIAGPSRHLPL